MDESDEDVNRVNAQLEQLGSSNMGYQLNRVEVQDRRTFVIQVAPGSTIYICVVRGGGLQSISWCFSTMFFHCGQNYINTVHSLHAGPDILNAIVHMQSPLDENAARHLMMLLEEVPRNPMGVRSLNEPEPFAPVTLFRWPLANTYCHFVRRGFQLLNSLDREPIFRDGIPRWLQLIRNSNTHLNQELMPIQHGLLPVDWVLNSNNTPNLIDELSSDSEPDNSQVGDVEPATGASADLRSNIFLGPEFEPYPQQFWSLNSSDEDPGEEADDESWESDFDDAESADTFILRDLRDLRSPSSGEASPINSTWVRYVCNANLANRENWDGGSCGTNETDSGSDLELSNDWQYEEDRSFETDFSRPMRRLIGDLPALNANEERERYAFINGSDPHDSSSNEALDEPETPPPVASGIRWRGPEHLPSAASNLLRANLMRLETLSQVESENPFRRISHEYQNNLMESMQSMRDSIQRNFFDLRNNVELLANTTSMPMRAKQPETKPVEEPIVPLKSFNQQTDELIAQLKKSLSM